MKRTGRIQRRTPLRRKAPRRGGASRSLILALDELARALCMTRAGAYLIDGSRSWVGPCRRCQITGALQWAHFNSRRFHSSRWDPDNAMPLCGGCHYAFAHHQPAAFRDWWLGELGPVRFDRLALRLKLPSRIDYRALLIALKIEWRELTGSAWQAKATA